MKYLVRKRPLLPLESASRNKYIVGIDRLRYNARVAIGEFVNISKINRIAANQITMRSLTAIAMSKIWAIDERNLSDALTNVPIRPMDVVL